MDTINSFRGKDAIAEVDARHMDAILKQPLLNIWLVFKCKFFFVCLFTGEDPTSFTQQIFKNAYCCWNANRCLLQNLTTLERVLQIWLHSGITAKTEHKNHNTSRKFSGIKRPLLAMNTQYSTGHRKHVEILRTKQHYIVSGGSHGSTHLFFFNRKQPSSSGNESKCY